ncbi:MAG: DUF4199 domain-containing protein [Bacteroidetes bacterium]|nr:DUF4199 domain-containing protein [Bacteroidota bacterium]
METQKASVKKIAYNYGVYLALISIIVLVIKYISNLDESWVLWAISTLTIISIFVYGIKSFKKENENYISIMEALKVGLAIAAIGGVISAIYTFIHYSFIYPEFIENIREQAMLEAMERSPKMDEETMEKTEIFMNFLTSPFMFATYSLIGSLFFGFIISLITGAIIKRARTDIF